MQMKRFGTGIEIVIRGDSKDIKSLPGHFPVLTRGKQDWSKHCGRLKRALNRRELDGF
jgi:hypothetical protein